MPKRIEDQPKIDSREYKILRQFVEVVERAVQEEEHNESSLKEGRKKRPPKKTQQVLADEG